MRKMVHWWRMIYGISFAAGVMYVIMRILMSRMTYLLPDENVEKLVLDDRRWWTAAILLFAGTFFAFLWMDDRKRWKTAVLALLCAGAGIELHGFTGFREMIYFSYWAFLCCAVNGVMILLPQKDPAKSFTQAQYSRKYQVEPSLEEEWKPFAGNAENGKNSKKMISFCPFCGGKVSEDLINRRTYCERCGVDLFISYKRRG